jgi:uncharacterized membrane protein
MNTGTCRLLNLLLLGTFYAGSAMVYPTLPERIPMHFDLSGRPDRWEARSFLSWFALPLIATAVAGFLELASRSSERHPQLWNVPDKRRFLALDPAARAPIIAHLRDFMAMVGMMSTALMMLVQLSIYRFATGHGSGLPVFVFAGTGIFLLVLLSAALRMNARVRTMIRDAHRGSS